MAAHGKPLEKDIQADIMKWLKKRPNSFTWKAQAGPYAPKGLPDIFHMEDGRPYAFEVKRPGGEVRPLQEKAIEGLMKAGVIALVVYSLEDVQYVFSDEYWRRAGEIG